MYVTSYVEILFLFAMKVLPPPPPKKKKDWNGNDDNEYVQDVEPGNGGSDRGPPRGVGGDDGDGDAADSGSAGGGVQM